jgi:GDP-D-mannose dehydratase
MNIQTEIDAKRIRPNDNKIIIGDCTKINTDIGWYAEITLAESLRNLVLYWEKELKVHSDILM